MNFKIKGTGELKELNIIDPRSGVNWISDFIGNYNGFEGMVYDDEFYGYHVSSEDFDWWEKVSSEYEKADNRVYEIKHKLDGQKREEFVSEIESINCDLEQCAGMMNTICDEYDADEMIVNDNGLLEYV